MQLCSAHMDTGSSRADASSMHHVNCSRGHAGIQSLWLWLGTAAPLQAAAATAAATPRPPPTSLPKPVTSTSTVNATRVSVRLSAPSVAAFVLRVLWPLLLLLLLLLGRLLRPLGI
eukprot:1136789-Pelagomonas_calceolata.AAC.6